MTETKPRTARELADALDAVAMRARALRARGDLDLLVLDYLQLVSALGEVQNPFPFPARK